MVIVFDLFIVSFRVIMMIMMIIAMIYIIFPEDNDDIDGDHKDDDN